MSKKYPLAKELEFLEHMSLIPNIYIYPFINIFVGMIPCKSDDKVTVTKIKTPGYEGHNLSTLVIEPKDCSDKLPCIVFYHGGGIILKAMKAHYQFAKWYAENAKCKVIFPDYRLMPKYRFPYAAEDCYSTYKWVLDNADKLNIDKNKIDSEYEYVHRRTEIANLYGFQALDDRYKQPSDPTAEQMRQTMELSLNWPKFE